MYFIVIPIIPDKKQPNIVIDKIIPVLTFSFDLIIVATKTPNDNPARLPTIAKIIINPKLLP